MNYNTFLTLFGLNPNNFKQVVSDPFVTDSGMTFLLEQRTDINRICPYCESKAIEIKGYFDRLIRCTVNSNQRHELIVKKVRFICKNCGKTYSPKLENIDKYSSITNYVKKLIVYDFFNRISFTDIARKYDVSITTIFNLFDETFPSVKRGKLPKVLCIDEFHFENDYDQNYCCILVDLKEKEIVDIIKNRKKEYLEEFFSSIDEKERNNVEIFISDMYDEYAAIKKKYFPKAIHIVDRFHIASQLTVAIKQRRVKVMNSFKITNRFYYNFMKRNWILYEQRKSKIPDKDIKNKNNGYIYSYEYIFYKTLKEDHDLNIAYEILQDLLVKSYKTNDKNLRTFFCNIANRLIALEDEVLKKVGSTFLKWLDQIINAYTDNAIQNGYTNSMAENTNNHIKTLIKISYGLNNFERMRKRCILISRKHQKRR